MFHAAVEVDRHPDYLSMALGQLLLNVSVSLYTAVNFCTSEIFSPQKPNHWTLPFLVPVISTAAMLMPAAQDNWMVKVK